MENRTPEEQLDLYAKEIAHHYPKLDSDEDPVDSFENFYDFLIEDVPEDMFTSRILHYDQNTLYYLQTILVDFMEAAKESMLTCARNRSHELMCINKQNTDDEFEATVDVMRTLGDEWEEYRSTYEKFNSFFQAVNSEINDQSRIIFENVPDEFIEALSVLMTHLRFTTSENFQKSYLMVRRYLDPMTHAKELTKELKN